MRRLAIAAIGAVALCGLGHVAHAQGRAGNPQAGAPPAPTDKAGYYDSKDIHKYWEDQEAKKRTNNRVAEGGTHSINIRTVLPSNRPLVHHLSVDTWVVMEGSATAVTGGELVNIKMTPGSDDTSGDSIKGGVEQPLKPGDILFVPPGVPHGFKDIKGFRAYLIRYPMGSNSGAGNPQASAPKAPTDKAAYFSIDDIKKTWADEDARNVANKRVMEGGSHSINIRIVPVKNAPLVHAESGDTWVVIEGTATAITGGELQDVKKNAASDDTSGSSIKNGIEQPLKPGDILFVPPGVPHGFKDMKGFHAYLIRYPTK